MITRIFAAQTLKKPLHPRASALAGMALASALLLAAPHASALTAQTITGFAPATPIAYSTGKTFTLSATGGGSGNAVTFASTTTAICTVATKTVTVLGVGTCSLTADQAGNASYSAAPQVSANVVINQGSQTISMTGLGNKTYGVAPFAITAPTATSGLAVSLSSTTPSICTISGLTITVLGAGTCSIAADQAGNANFTAAPEVIHSFTVAQEGQGITFTPPAGQVYGVAPLTLTATAGSGLPVIFSTSTPSVCTASGTNGTTLTIVGAGSCIIDANQAGNVNFLAAPQAERTITIAKASQTITFTAPGNTTYGSPVTLVATATSGLAVAFTSSTTSVCTVSGNTVTPVALGTCTIDANQAGDANHNAATQVAKSLTISIGSQTISFTPPTNVGYGAPATLSATATSGLAVTLTSTTPSICTVAGSTLTPVALGTCSITASQAGNVDYTAATSVTKSFPVIAGSQSISFTAPPTKILGMAPFTIAATASSGLSVVFSSTTTTICTVSGSTVTLVATGSCGISASQAGNTLYNAATPVAQSFAVNPNVPPTVTLTSPASGQNFAAPAAITLTATASSSDTTVAQVEFFNGSTSLGKVTQAPYTLSWSNVAIGSYSIKATATDALGGTTSTTPLTVTVANPIAVAVTSPTSTQSFTAPATLTLTATATDSTGSVTQVAFYNGTSLMGTVTQSPYTVTVPNNPAGNYAITAQASDSHSIVATSAVVNVTVAAATNGPERVYDVHTDQLDTPRLVSDLNGNAVWQWGQDEPFGNTIANQDPNNTGNQFVFNLRFAGQYFDIETGTHYNINRDYDPSTGRYLESDPIGLDGGSASTYGYVGGAPLSTTDYFGLSPVAGVFALPSSGMSIGEAASVLGMDALGIILLPLTIPGDTSPAAAGGYGPVPARTPSQEAQAEAEHDAYKRICQEDPPPGLDKCARAKWERDRAQQCMNMRQDWDNKWWPGRHAQAIADEFNRFNKWAKVVANCTCP